MSHPLEPDGALELNGHIPILITARLASSRLPQKHLQQLAPGQPSIVCLISRLRSASLPLVLCIPEGPSDEKLRQVALAERIACARGDGENVLRRYAQTMRQLATTCAIIVDADDVFVSIEAIRRLAEIYTDEDMIRFSGMAYGGAPYLLSRRFVEAMLAHGASPNGWSSALDAVSGKKLSMSDFSVWPNEQAYRLSLDYPEDLHFLSHLYQILGPQTVHMDIIRYITANKDALMSEFPTIFDGSIAEQARRHLNQSNASKN
jgi:spore coat polysaccharide biosynthesis protein SpsF (cytidylyltransferase family)